jgi:hypothetical protein
MLLISSMCMMQITHGASWPPDRPATEYPTCTWSSLILCTKSPTPALILVAARHVASTTYTSRDKQTCFSTPNNSFCVSSIDVRRIQIQTRTSQLLITHINQDTNHLVSPSPLWWVHWQLQMHKVWILNSRLIEAQLNDQKPKTN